MSSQRSTRSVSAVSVGTRRRSGRGHDAERDASPPPRAPRRARRGRRAAAREVDAQPARTGAAQQRPRHAGRAGVHPRLGAGLGDAVEHPLQRRGRLGRVHRPVPAEAGRGRDRAREHRGQRRLVDLDDDPLGAGHPAAYVGDVVATPSASACASSRRAPWSESTLSPRGFSTVAASVHGPATWTLNGARVALGLLLELVEVLGQQGPGPAVVDAGRVGEPPAGRLQVGAEVGDHGQRPAGHAPRAAPRPGSSGR